MANKTQCKIFEMGAHSGEMVEDHQKEINDFLNEVQIRQVISHTQIQSSVGSIITTIFYKDGF